MGQVLYRKYRSRSLSEVVGQEHITKTLENALKSGKVGHALLLTGPKGVGKTSVARILAHRINDLDYSGETKHIDIIEIDAASNRRIDEIRELREKARVLPALAKYKIYIIDEVHMLTREAFNALLKTLEEPPAHVVFILATTDMHKLPETIISRTQVFNFKPIEIEDLKRQLAKISASESINISEGAIEAIAAHAGGSFRDALSILDQARSFGQGVSKQEIEQLLGIASAEQIDYLIQQLVSSDLRALHNNLQQMRIHGAEPSVIAKQLANKIREGLLAGSLNVSTPRALKLLDDLLEVKVSHEPQSKLEIVLLKFAAGNQTSNIPVQNIKTAGVEAEPPEAPKAEEPTPKPVSKTPPKTNVEPELVWAEVLSELKTQKGLLYSIARLAKPTFENGTLYLDFEFALHRDRAKEQQNSKRISEIIQNLSGQDIKLDFRVAKRSTDYQPLTHKSGEIENISNIFGDAEVLD